MTAGRQGQGFVWRAFAFSVAALFSLVLLAGTQPHGAAGLDRAVFDSLQRSEPRTYDPESPVRIIDIDSASLAEFGQWPWPRTYLAAMVERLSDLGAAAIAFDVLFAEPDRTSPAEIATAWTRFDPERELPPFDRLRDHDAVFADAIAASPTVLGAILTYDGGGRTPPVRASFSRLGPPAEPFVTAFTGAEVNLPLLSERAHGVGAITLSERAGGIVRTAPLLSRVNKTLIASLSIEALRVAQDASGYLVKTVGASGELSLGDARGLVSLRVGDFEVPLREDGSIWVRYSGSDPRRTIPATRLLSDGWDDPALAEQIAGRIILVGTSAPGLRDLVATPLSDSELGVAVHAEIIEQIVAGDFLRRPDWASGLEIATMLGLGLLVAALTAVSPPIWAFLFAGIAAGAAFLGAWWSFAAYGMLLGPVWPALGAIAPWGVGALVKYAQSERDKRAVRAQFSHFLAPEVVDEIARDPARYLRPGGEDRELTILFCDVRKFSTLSKDMTPQQLIAYLNDFLTPMSEVIVERGGTIDKYIGDAIMAFWNAPKARPDHRALAVSAVLAMEQAGRRLNTRLDDDGLPRISFGIGLNTGVCSVGSIGSRARLDYTCIGDAVNVASRLEGLTKQYGVDNCAAESVIDGASEFACIELDIVTVVGRQDRLERVFTVLGDRQLARSAEFASTRQKATEALAAYRAQEFDRAAPLFRDLAVQEPRLKDYAAILLDRIDDLRQVALPADWDGVYRSSIK